MSFPSDFQTIQNAVLAKGRLDTTDDLAKVKDWINQAYYEACIETDFYDSSSAATALAANATNVAVPSALVVVDYVVPTGTDGTVWGPMEMVPFQLLLEARAYSGNAAPWTGAPSRYAWSSGGSPSIEIWPAANGGEILTFYGSRLPTALSANGDLPIIPEPYASKILEYGALVNAAEFKKDSLVLSEFYTQYQNWIMAFRGFLNTRRGKRVESFFIDKQRPWPHGNSVDSPYNN